MQPGKKILCPTDFSQGSSAAEARAVELARALQAEIELLHVYQLPVVALPDVPVTVSPTYVADLTTRIDELLAEERKALAQQGITVTTKVIEGIPSEAIVQRAEEIGAEMIVIGTHGRTGFRRLLLGSVAEQVVRSSKIPVMTVHLTPPAA
jgi:nucleotide-binding universal stress UspA family protein